MSINKQLSALVEELNYIHSAAFSWGNEHGLPNFVTDEENEFQIHFTPKASEHLRKISLVIFQNRDENLPKIEIDNYEKVIKQTVANMFAKGDFNESFLAGEKSAIKELKASVEKTIAEKIKPFTHYFPAWTIGIESETPFDFGPVRIFTRKNWIDSVDFPQKGKDEYLGETEANNNWKALLNSALEDQKSQEKVPGLAGDVYRAIKDCPSIVT